MFTVSLHTALFITSWLKESGFRKGPYYGGRTIFSSQSSPIVCGSLKLPKSRLSSSLCLQCLKKTNKKKPFLPIHSGPQLSCCLLCLIVNDSILKLNRGEHWQVKQKIAFFTPCHCQSEDSSNKWTDLSPCCCLFSMLSPIHMCHRTQHWKFAKQRTCTQEKWDKNTGTWVQCEVRGLLLKV